MRLPNGYGSVIKLKGKRRKPYAVRTSEIAEFVEIDAPKDPPSNIRRELNRYNFKWKRKAQIWVAISSDAICEFAETLMQEEGYEYSIAYRQTFKYLEYFAKQEHAYAFLSELNNADVVAEHIKYAETPTFAEMYGKWKNYRKALPDKISSNTWRNYEIAFNHLSICTTRNLMPYELMRSRSVSTNGPVNQTLLSLISARFLTIYTSMP